MRMDTMSIDVGRRQLDAELYLPPDGDGPWPGVLLLHELFGLDGHVRADARDLARHGYLVLCPDLYSDGGMRRYCMKMFFSTASLAGRAEVEPVREVHRCLDVLKSLDECNGRLGMIGMCLTGGFVLQMARRDDLAAPVVYHHSLGVRGSGIPADQAADIGTVVQGHFAELDRRLCPKSRVDALAAQLGDKLEVNWYPGVGHGLRSAFRHTPAATEAWERTLAFFQDHLQS